MHPNIRAAHWPRRPGGAALGSRTPYDLLLAASVGALLLALPSAYPFRSLVVPAATAGLLALPLLLLVGRATRHRRDACWRRWMRGLGLMPMVIAMAAGYGWAHWRVGQVLAERLPQCADARSRTFEFEILDDPVAETDTIGRVLARFPARVVVPADGSCPELGQHRVRLSWYDPPTVLTGQRWHGQGRLRPPWSYRNPAGFDYERWLLGQGLAGTGYVASARLVAAVAAEDDPVTRVRAALRSWITGLDLDRGAIILALMIGDDTGITTRQWQVLRDSGTVHLLVVSGLHVGMIAGVLFQLGRFIARCCPPLLLRLGSRRIGAALAMVGSGGYVWLAGAGVPAVRAWLMSVLALSVLASGRLVGPRRVLGLVLAVIVLGNPLVVHQQGFWLSFGAVLALVLYFEPRISPPAGGPGTDRLRDRLLGPIRVLLMVQGVLLVALSPLIAIGQASIPPVAPLVNALAVPVVTVVVLPLVLLTGLTAFSLPVLAGWLAGIADLLLGLVEAGAASAAAAPGMPVGVGGTVEWLLLGGILLLLGGAPGRTQSVMLLALWFAVLLPDGSRPPPSTVRITALDVGQGSAILIETHRHRLLYDTGAVYPSGFDLGDAVVVPSLRTSGDRRLDALVLSHDDVDHNGGAAAVLRRLRPDRVWTSYAPAVPVSKRERWLRCRSGVSWSWDRVRFSFLHPPGRWRGSDNDGSCVLLVEAGERRVLIAGDISARVERRLPSRSVDLLFAPHHGSATSSSWSLVRGFRPGIVFISTDRRSRYGHPHPDVLARYRTARVFVTGREGALQWQSDEPWRVESWRRDAAYWHGHWPEAR